MRSSGDGNADESFIDKGSVINRSFRKIRKQELYYWFISHPKTFRRIRAISCCCSIEQWFSRLIIIGYGDVLKRLGSIKRIIDSNKHGLTSV